MVLTYSNIFTMSEAHVGICQTCALHANPPSKPKYIKPQDHAPYSKLYLIYRIEALQIIIFILQTTMFMDPYFPLVSMASFHLSISSQ